MIETVHVSCQDSTEAWPRPDGWPLPRVVFTSPRYNKGIVIIKKGIITKNRNMGCMSMVIRFFKFLPELTNEGCWVWRGSRTKAGYGQFNLKWENGKSVIVRAHKLAYELLVGNVPDGLELDHLCHNRACCNPAHLEAVTHEENLRRAFERNRKPKCPAGHIYDEENTMTDKNGYRFCRECNRLRNASGPRQRKVHRKPRSI